MKLFFHYKISAKSVLFIACIAILIVSIITASNAWLFQYKSRTHNLQTSNFTMAANIFFLQSNNQQVSAAGYKDPTTGYYLVNITDPNAQNYAGKLNINIRYKGVTKSYLRVYIGDMWLVNNKAINKMDTAYITTPNWLDNRIYDNYYYYTGGTPRGLVNSPDINQEVTIQFVSGIENMAPITGGQLYLEIRAEAVQLNRIEAFWGISTIPQ